MNPYTAVIAQNQLEQLWADAAEHRLARAARSSQTRRSWFRLTFGSSKSTAKTADATNVVPKLTGYPYRG